MDSIIIIITWLPFILNILTIKPNAFFSQHIHEVDSVSTHFTVQKTKAQGHVGSKMFKPRFVCLPYKLQKLLHQPPSQSTREPGRRGRSAHAQGGGPLNQNLQDEQEFDKEPC